MNYSKSIIIILLSAFTIGIYAQSLKEKPKTLWVVDNVALNDSVFDYTLNQMRSDSAAELACRVLSLVYPKDIDSITVLDLLGFKCL